jgi:hypothetical protein
MNNTQRKRTIVSEKKSKINIDLFHKRLDKYFDLYYNSVTLQSEND